MFYRIEVRMDGDLHEAIETHDFKIAYRFLNSWFRRTKDYVGVTIHVESRKN